MNKKLSTKEILNENLSRTAPTILTNTKVWLHNIRSLHNVGSVFRCSDAFGINEILISGYTPTPPRAEISKTAIGAEEFVQWSHHNDISSALEALKKENYTLIGLEQTSNSIDLPNFKPIDHEKMCVIMGNEVTGIDDELIEHIDHFVTIPQFGQKHSLNVSVATGIILYALLEKLWNT